MKKREVMEFLLREPVVCIAIKTAEVSGLPGWCETIAPAALIEIGLNLRIPILDLVIADWGFSGTLSFEEVPQHLEVPWTAVFGMGVRGECEFIWWTDAPLADATEVKRLMS